jgi:nucleotide-binding universal stress UspA family protein
MPAHHLLVPIDFSADADYALEYAIRLAKKLQAKLTLLHVIEPLVVGSVESMPYTFLQDLEDKLTQAMVPYHERVTAAGLSCDYTIVHGVPFQVIIDTARMAHIDLIIMGTHGRTGLRHVLMGSVAEKVVRLAPCAVLVTRPSDTMPTPEGEADEAPRTVSAPDQHAGRVVT